MDDRIRVYILNFWTIQKPNTGVGNQCVYQSFGFYHGTRDRTNKRIETLFHLAVTEYVRLL